MRWGGHLLGALVCAKRSVVAAGGASSGGSTWVRQACGPHTRHASGMGLTAHARHVVLVVRYAQQVQPVLQQRRRQLGESGDVEGLLLVQQPLPLELVGHRLDEDEALDVDLAIESLLRMREQGTGKGRGQGRGGGAGGRRARQRAGGLGGTAVGAVGRETVGWSGGRVMGPRVEAGRGGAARRSSGRAGRRGLTVALRPGTFPTSRTIDSRLPHKRQNQYSRQAPGGGGRWAGSGKRR